MNELKNGGVGGLRLRGEPPQQKPCASKGLVPACYSKLKLQKSHGLPCSNARSANARSASLLACGLRYLTDAPAYSQKCCNR